MGALTVYLVLTVAYAVVIKTLSDHTTHNQVVWVSAGGLAFISLIYLESFL